MNNELRERTVWPILIPALAILLTEVIVFSMSQVLLAAGEKGAVVVALGVALSILVGASAIAAGKRIRTSSIVGLLVVVGLVTVAAGAVAFQRGPAYQREEAANLPKIAVTAKNLAFDTKKLELSTAGAEIDFTNADTQPHNIAIFADEAMTKNLFRGEITQGGSKATYKVGPLKAGTYHFHCDVHPQMMGEAVVGNMPAGAGEHAGSMHG
jgi:plastocyanin